MANFNEMKPHKGHLSDEWHELEASNPKFSEKWDEQHPSKAVMSERYVEMNPSAMLGSDKWAEMRAGGRDEKWEGMKSTDGDRSIGMKAQSNKSQGSRHNMPENRTSDFGSSKDL